MKMHIRVLPWVVTVGTGILFKEMIKDINELLV